MRKVIAFDIDGVLADFIKAFTELANDHFGTPVWSTTEQETWDLESIYGDKGTKKLWEIVRDTYFWSEVEPLVSPEVFERINDLSILHDIYFVTARAKDKYISTRGVTTMWLKEHGIFNPTVILCERKGDLMKAIRAHYSIEDKWDNAHAIAWLTKDVDTKSYLLDRPYNRVKLPGIGTKRVIRVDSVDQYLDAIEEEK